MAHLTYGNSNIMNDDLDTYSSVQNDFIFTNINSTFTFTNIGASGANGPTSLDGYGTSIIPVSRIFQITLSNGIQYWKVLRSGKYSFTVAGAGSVTSSSLDTIKNGYGIVLNIVSYNLIAGTVVSILVGHIGVNYAGGGGTFVAIGNTPLFCAAGAGGVGNQPDTNFNINGSILTSGQNATFGGVGGVGGTNGNGGTGNTITAGGGGAGGGFLTSGTKGTSFAFPGAGFLQNGVGGTGGGGALNPGNGGFGGGGGGGSGQAGGGGGGYSGGGPGNRASNGGGGGGGGSYDITGAYNGSAINMGMGYVKVRLLEEY